MRFGNVNSDTAAPVATAAVHVIAGATASNTVGSDCDPMARKKRRRRKMVPSSPLPQ